MVRNGVHFLKPYLVQANWVCSVMFVIPLLFFSFDVNANSLKQCINEAKGARKAQMGAAAASNSSGSAANALMGQSTGNSNAAGNTGAGTCNMGDSIAGPASSCQQAAQKCMSTCNSVTKQEERAPAQNIAKQCSQIAMQCGQISQQAAANKAQCQKAKEAEKSAGKPPEMPKPQEGEENPEEQVAQCPADATPNFDGSCTCPAGKVLKENSCVEEESGEAIAEGDTIEQLDTAITALNNSPSALGVSADKFVAPAAKSVFGVVRDHQRRTALFAPENEAEEFKDPFAEGEEDALAVPELKDLGGARPVAAYRPSASAKLRSAVHRGASRGAKKAAFHKKGALSPEEMTAAELGAELLNPLQHENPRLKVDLQEEKISNLLTSVTGSHDSMKLCSLPAKINRLESEGGNYGRTRAAALRRQLQIKMVELDQPDADIGLSMICNHFTAF